jgi:hypothetical protein
MWHTSHLWLYDAIGGIIKPLKHHMSCQMRHIFTNHSKSKNTIALCIFIKENNLQRWGFERHEVT